MWINLDAAFLGSTWISQKYRPDNWIEKVDSIAINFSKLLLNGTGGSLFFVSDKKQLN
jgi:glutamate/tyrosine decarboxylase-like PLP-dependent enzyme